MFCVLSCFTGAVFFTVNNALPVTSSLRLIGLRVLVLLLHVAHYWCMLSECWASKHNYVSCESDGPTTATAAVIFTYKNSLKNFSLTFFFSYFRSLLFALWHCVVYWMATSVSEYPQSLSCAEDIGTMETSNRICSRLQTFGTVLLVLCSVTSHWF